MTPDSELAAVFSTTLPDGCVVVGIASHHHAAQAECARFVQRQREHAASKAFAPRGRAHHIADVPTKDSQLRGEPVADMNLAKQSPLPQNEPVS